MKIHNINKLNSNIKTIPKDFLETSQVEWVNLLTDNFAHTSENLHDYNSLIENIGRTGELEAIDGIASGSSDIGEHFHLTASQIPFLSIALKSIEPIKDFKNGEYKSAIVKGSVRTLESLTVLPFKLAWALIGGGLGVLKQTFGIESESAGFKNGFLSNNKKWVNVRSGVEQVLINPYSFFYNLAPPSSEKRIETDKNIESIINKKIEQSVKHEKDKKLLDIDYICEDMTKALKQAELKVNTLLGNSLEIKPIQEDDMEVFSQEYDHEAVKKRIKAIKEQQVLFQKTYDSYMSQFLKLINNNSFANSEQEKIIQRIINTIKGFYEKNIGTSFQNIEKIAKILEANKSISQKTKKSGYEKIAGYSDVKQELNNIFIKPIKKFNAGKNVELPNLILFYGPQGCGKTLFSNALIDETKCNIIELDLCRDANENIKNLKKAIVDAEINYKKDNIYSIIKIDELDMLLDDTKEILADIDLNTISKNHFCTIVATTNFPKNINKALIPDTGFKSIYIAPAENSNIQDILKLYLNDLENIKEAHINIKELANYIQSSASPNLYSNARIVRILQQIIMKHNSEITTDIIKQYFKENQADIEQEIITQYRKDAL